MVLCVKYAQIHYLGQGTFVEICSHIIQSRLTSVEILYIAWNGHSVMIRPDWLNLGMAYVHQLTWRFEGDCGLFLIMVLLVFRDSSVIKAIYCIFPPFTCIWFSPCIADVYWLVEMSIWHASSTWCSILESWIRSNMPLISDAQARVAYQVISSK